MLKRILVLSLALQLCIGTLAVLAGDTASPLTPFSKRSDAPELKLKDIDGKTHDLSKLHGKVVLVNFWATWCPPCLHEMPSMQKIYRVLSREHFEILAVNVGEDDKKVFAFSGTLKPSLSFPLLLDLDSRVMHKWKVMGMPTSFIVDKNGRVALRIVGGRDFDNPAMLKQIQMLIEEGR